MLVQEQQKQNQCTTVIELRAARDMPNNQQNTKCSRKADYERSAIPRLNCYKSMQERPKARVECLKRNHEISCQVVTKIGMTSETEVQKSNMENQLEMTSSASYGLNSMNRKDKSLVLEAFMPNIT